MQVPRVIHRLFYDRNYPTALPTSWTCEPHEVILRDRRGAAGCPRPGWIVRACYDGFDEPAVRYVTLDFYGTGMDYSRIPDPQPQPFEIGPERRHDSGWWRHLLVTPDEWRAFVASCQQFEECAQ